MESTSCGGSSAKKWACGVCTYENWPRAARCAICCHPKNYIPFMDPHRPQDIYEIASMVESESNNSSFLYNPRNKWSCSSCTYLNWPKSVKCTQCQRRRSISPNSSPASSVKDLRDKKHQTDHLHHRVVKGNDNTTYPLYPSWTPSSTSPPTGTLDNSISLPHRQPGHDNYYNNDRNYLEEPERTRKPPPPSSVHQRSSTIDQSTQMFMNFNPTSKKGQFKSSKSPPPSSRDVPLMAASAPPSSPGSSDQKWTCLSCTFENWPRSSKCSMCHSVKPLVQLVDSMERLTFDRRRSSKTHQKAEASGGLTVSEEVTPSTVTSPQSGFSSDAEDVDNNQRFR